jgi:hypothetical protein
LAEEPQRHVVVLDCNIYLDVARLVGAPFTWEAFDAQVAKMARDPVPHPSGPAFDSLRAVAVCRSGRFAGDEPLEVWTSAHIDRMVRWIAIEKLGWSVVEADTLVDVLIYDLTASSGGGTVGTVPMPDGHPPLDHEDGLIWGACRFLAGDDVLSHVYCVTGDKPFKTAYTDGKLTRHSRLVTQAQMVAAVRAARAQLAIRTMPGPRR